MARRGAPRGAPRRPPSALPGAQKPAQTTSKTRNMLPNAVLGHKTCPNVYFRKKNLKTLAPGRGVLGSGGGLLDSFIGPGADFSKTIPPTLLSLPLRPKRPPWAGPKLPLEVQNFEPPWAIFSRTPPVHSGAMHCSVLVCATDCGSTKTVSGQPINTPWGVPAVFRTQFTPQLPPMLPHCDPQCGPPGTPIGPIGDPLETPQIWPKTPKFWRKRKNSRFLGCVQWFSRKKFCSTLVCFPHAPDPHFSNLSLALYRTQVHFTAHKSTLLVSRPVKWSRVR